MSLMEKVSMPGKGKKRKEREGKERRKGKGREGKGRERKGKERKRKERKGKEMEKHLKIFKIICNTSDIRGSWCSGITPAQHAGGPGFNPRTVHALLFILYFVEVRKGRKGGESTA